MRPNDLLKYEIMRWARGLGKQHFVLGGGYRPNDGIYRYKLSFAPLGAVPFFTGTRVLNMQLYDTLVQNAAAVGCQSSGNKASDYFPAYRAM